MFQISLGHCTKLLTILKKVIKNKNIKWIVVADDDTLLRSAQPHILNNCHTF